MHDVSDSRSLWSSTKADEGNSLAYELSAIGLNVYCSTDPKSSTVSSDDDVDGLRDCSPASSSTSLNEESDDDESSESLSESLNVARSLQRAVSEPPP